MVVVAARPAERQIEVDWAFGLPVEMVCALRSLMEFPEPWVGSWTTIEIPERLDWVPSLLAI